MDLYFKIKEQRKYIEAPVDTLGCCCVDETLPLNLKQFHILVALVLSPRTKDDVTHAALSTLHRTLNPLEPATLLSKTRQEIERCIHTVGFSRRKAEYLFKISQAVKDEMPMSLLGVLRLPGVGKKIAHLYMLHALGDCAGVSVDTHVHRISNRIGLVTTKTPEQTRVTLENLFPVEEWGKINNVLVGFGQTICSAPRPKCNLCIVREICPFTKQ